MRATSAISRADSAMVGMTSDAALPNPKLGSQPRSTDSSSDQQHAEPEIRHRQQADDRRPRSRGRASGRGRRPRSPRPGCRARTVDQDRRGSERERSPAARVEDVRQRVAAEGRRVAEIAAQQPADVVDILHRDRAVEAEPDAQQLDLGLASRVAPAISVASSPGTDLKMRKRIVTTPRRDQRDGARAARKERSIDVTGLAAPVTPSAGRGAGS